jgi:hypothetical protein
MEAMEMERPMNEWNDDRLDELNGRVKEGFAQVDKRFEQVDERFVRLEGEMKEGFARVDERFEQTGKRFDPLASREEVVELRKDMNAGLNRISDRIDRLHHVLIVAAVGVIGTLLVDGIWG